MIFQKRKCDTRRNVASDKGADVAQTPASTGRPSLNTLPTPGCLSLSLASQGCLSTSSGILRMAVKMYCRKPHTSAHRLRLPSKQAPPPLQTLKGGAGGCRWLAIKAR